MPFGYSIVQTPTPGVTTTGNTQTLNFVSTPASGNMLICVAIFDSTASTGSMTSTGWTGGPHAVNFAGIYLWWKIAGASEPTAVQITATDATATIGMATYEISTLVTPTPTDTTGASNGVSSGAATMASGTTTATAQADDLVIAAFSTQGAVTWNSFSVGTAQSLFTAGSDKIAVVFNETSATGTQTITATASGTTSGPSALIQPFKLAAAPLPPIPERYIDNSIRKATMRRRRYFGPGRGVGG